MIAHRNFEDCQPLTWVGRVPVYLATAIAAAHGVTMILTALASALGLTWFFSAFVFSPGVALQDFHLWQFLTYAFVNKPGLLEAFQLLMLAMFGQEVEKFLGRKSFAILYVLLVLAGPILLSAFAFLGYSQELFGSSLVHFAVFIAFVLIYPRAEIFFSIQARWLGLALFGVYSLTLLSDRAWPELSIFWWECAVAALWLMREGVASVSLPGVSGFLRERRSRKSLKVVRKEPEEDVSVHDSIDPILEKIARRGIGSLTRAERDKLEKARAALLQKERPH